MAHRVITLLNEGRAVDEVTATLRTETGGSFAAADFVAALDRLGFLAAVDGRIREDSVHPRPSLPWLRPGHVRWALHPLAPAVVAGFAVVGVVMLALHPALLPSYRMLVWSRHAGLVLAVNAAIAWTLILVHELAHLAMARAAGAPARITLSTRLQFLAAQTDVSGVWAAPRRTRMAVYLAGMCIDVCNAGVCLLILGLAIPHGLIRSLLAVVVAETLLALPIQFMVFMRTDVYFVLQDLTGCANCTRTVRHISAISAGTLPGASGTRPDRIPIPAGDARRYSVAPSVSTASCCWLAPRSAGLAGPLG